MIEWLKSRIRSKYVRMLEDEVSRQRTETERLRSENRALLNSLLGTAGFPPIEFPEAPQPSAFNGPRLRKRSWHQIQAWRENGAHRDSSTNFEDAPSVRTNGPVPHS